MDKNTRYDFYFSKDQAIKLKSDTIPQKKIMFMGEIVTEKVPTLSMPSVGMANTVFIGTGTNAETCVVGQWNKGQPYNLKKKYESINGDTLIDHIDDIDSTVRSNVPETDIILGICQQLNIQLESIYILNGLIVCNGLVSATDTDSWERNEFISLMKSNNFIRKSGDIFWKC